MLKVEQVSRQFGGLAAVSNVSFSLDQDSIPLQRADPECDQPLEDPALRLVNQMRSASDRQLICVKSSVQLRHDAATCR